MKPRRRAPRPGTHLAPIPAIGVIASIPELEDDHIHLTQAGYTLKATVRPYYARSRLTTFKFIWRRRKDGINVTYSITWRAHIEFKQLEPSL